MRSPVEQPKRIAAAAGWTEDQFKILFSALVHGKEADWSMGDDAPPAFLSTLAAHAVGLLQAAFRAGHQSSDRSAARIARHVAGSASQGRRHVADPAASMRGQLAELSETFGPVHHMDFTFPAATGVPGARRALLSLHYPSERRRASGPPPPFRSRRSSKERARLPALLATAAVWKAMVREGLWDVPLVVESAQVFDTHHVALLVAAGASAVRAVSGGPVCGIAGAGRRGDACARR